jgi:ring-1,2-phenylacetyl-CoA epoxidase subunit PaaC
MGAEMDEDKLAYQRDERDFKNCLMAELPNGDWGQTVLKLFLFSQYVYLLYDKLKTNENDQLAAIAEKSIKESLYHVKWSREWVVRLGDGTEESRKKMLSALEYLWPYTGEFFIPAPYENMRTMGFDVMSLKNGWFLHVMAILEEASLCTSSFTEKSQNCYMHTGGKTGIHTENMGFILAEMQYLQRMHPGATW